MLLFPRFLRMTVPATKSEMKSYLPLLSLAILTSITYLHTYIALKSTHDSSKAILEKKSTQRRSYQELLKTE